MTITLEFKVITLFILLGSIFVHPGKGVKPFLTFGAGDGLSGPGRVITPAPPKTPGARTPFRVFTELKTHEGEP